MWRFLLFCVMILCLRMIAQVQRLWNGVKYMCTRRRNPDCQWKISNSKIPMRNASPAGFLNSINPQNMSWEPEKSSGRLTNSSFYLFFIIILYFLSLFEYAVDLFIFIEFIYYIFLNLFLYVLTCLNFYIILSKKQKINILVFISLSLDHNSTLVWPLNLDTGLISSVQ